ncbi:MAG: hypothetical protein WC584_02620 [Candidatus Pacearchaeota archaeon]
MAKQGGTLVHLLAWVTGVVVSLVVGFGMINGTLVLPIWLGGGSAAADSIVVFFGWIVLITTLISAVMALLKK